jgi:hypothetical protein
VSVVRDVSKEVCVVRIGLFIFDVGLTSSGGQRAPQLRVGVGLKYMCDVVRNVLSDGAMTVTDGVLSMFHIWILMLRYSERERSSGMCGCCLLMVAQ